MQFNAAALFMYATGIGLLIFMFTHPDGVVSLVKGGLDATSGYIGSFAKF